MHWPYEAISPWRVSSSETVYSNPWIDLVHNEVITPGGTLGIYGKVRFKNLALGVVAVEDDLSIWLVGQYRFPLGLYSWEIPEGGGAQNEPALHAIQRELLEETGLKALNWRIMLTLHLSNSVSDELALLYLATGLSLGEAQPDDTERIHVMKAPFSEVYQAVLDGRITDAMSVAGILRLALLMESGWKPEDEAQ